ncbi:hypothetical protein VPH35_114177 [Triticum aestivum]
MRRVSVLGTETPRDRGGGLSASVMMLYVCCHFEFSISGTCRGQAWRSGEVLPTCAKRSWVRTSLSALHFAGVRLGSYNPSPDPTLCGSFYALGLSFISGTCSVLAS